MIDSADVGWGSFGKMTIKELRLVLPPPESPVDSKGRWSDVEDSLGVNVPKDFKSLIEAYGTGVINEFLWVLNPFSGNPHLELTNQVHVQCDALRRLRAEDSVEVPFPIFPEAGGLFPWGISDNGDVGYWLTDGSPDDWTVVVNAAREPKYFEFESSFTSFLVAVLTRQVCCDIFPESFPGGPPQFRPFVLRPGANL